MVSSAHEILTVALPSERLRDGGYEGTYRVFGCLLVLQFQVLLKQCSRSHQESRALLELGSSLVFYQGPKEGCSWAMAPPFPMASV